MRTNPHPQLLLVGEQIRKRRLVTGLSQDNFALETGLARSYYSGIERGKQNPTVLNLIRIADGLRCEMGDLFPKMRDLRKGKTKPDGTKRASLKRDLG